MIQFKKAIYKLSSLIVIVLGVRGLITQVIETFYLYESFQNSSGQLFSDKDYLYKILLQQLVFKALTNFISTSYGIALLSKHSSVIKFSQFIANAILILLTYYVNYAYPLPLQ